MKSTIANIINKINDRPSQGAVDIATNFGLDKKNWSEPRQPVFLMLVGLPGSGKSTFIKKLLEESNEDFAIASTDDIVERECAKMGLTYSEGFAKVNFKQAQSEFKDVIFKAGKARKNIIIDQTNVGGKSRKSKLGMIPLGYDKICLIFDVSESVMKTRLENRARETGKSIPYSVIKQMTESWQTPSRAEGFDSIIEVIQ